MNRAMKRVMSALGVLMLVGALAGCGGTNGACTLTGSWSGIAGGTTVYMDFNSDGTTLLRIPQIGANIAGTWAVSGTQLTLTDNGCTTSGPGTYDVQFDGSCGSAVTVKISDACKDRVTTFDGTTLVH